MAFFLIFPALDADWFRRAWNMPKVASARFAGVFCVEIFLPHSIIWGMLKINVEDIWAGALKEAESAARNEPVMSAIMEEVFLSRDNIFDAICFRIAAKLESRSRQNLHLYKAFCDAFESDESIRENVLKDIMAVRERDPACVYCIAPILYFKGFHAITTHRVSHWLWGRGKIHSALYLQSLASDVFAVDIHPAARFGGGILLDHATSFVAGETSVVEDNVSILHEVTLGGTGNEVGDRHPKVRSGVLIGAGAKLIGNIIIGENAKIGAGSVVLDNVPAHTTVAGVPARVVSCACDEEPALCMNQKLD